MRWEDGIERRSRKKKSPRFRSDLSVCREESVDLDNEREEREERRERERVCVGI